MLPQSYSVSRQSPPQPDSGIRRRWRRERRRRAVGRAYDMALEIARVVPPHSSVLDVGTENGFTAHHLKALLGGNVLGIDLEERTALSVPYIRYDGIHFPAEDRSFDAVLLCYLLHHAQDVTAVLGETRRVLRGDGVAVVYEDIPRICWDQLFCWIHDHKWREKTGPCTFHLDSEWRAIFESCGFEVVMQRELSRWRNFIHPVSRSFYLLRPSA